MRKITLTALLLLLILLGASGAAEPAVAATRPTMAGQWDFIFGTMTLTQQNSSVKGTYEWFDGSDSGQIRGVVIEELNQFHGVWVSQHNPIKQGFLDWQLAPDRASFSGISERGDATSQWCGVRAGQPLLAGCGFSGEWQLRFGSPPDLTGQASLVQTGRFVEGSYVDAQGNTGQIVDGLVTITSLTEARLTGAWRDSQGSENSFDWRLNLTTGQTFQGRRDPGNSEWCGWRPGADEPSPCGWEG